MGASSKPYKELRAAMDEHGFRLLETARDVRERWIGLRWTEDHPLVINPGINAHASQNLVRQVLSAAGVETVDRAKKRNAQAIKDRRRADREREREAERSREKHRDEILEHRTAPVAVGVQGVLTRHTAAQLLQQQRMAALSPTQARRLEARERELAELDHLMRQQPSAGGRS